MLDRELNLVTKADLEELIQYSVCESNTIEYKRSLSISTDKEKQEFLKDVSALANSSGGDILFGIKEEGGIAKELIGIIIDNKDVTILRVEDILRNGIQPRIPYIRMHFIELDNSKSAFIIRVQKSWLSPHRIIYNKNNNFYIRLSAGSYPMDVNQLRSEFIASETLTKKLDDFKLERISKILANDTPILMRDGPKVVLHLFPLSSFNKGTSIDMHYVSQDTYNRLKPISNSPWGWRFNFDGLLTYSGDKGRSHSYVQLFRNGIIEAVCGTLFSKSEKPTIYSLTLKKSLDEALSGYAKLLKELNVNPPISTTLTMLGVKGYRMGIDNPFIFDEEDINMIDRDILFLPEILIEEYNPNIEVLLAPIYDSIWNACGFGKAPIFDVKTQSWSWQ